MTLMGENRNARGVTSSETNPTRSSVRTKPSLRQHTGPRQGAACIMEQSHLPTERVKTGKCGDVTC